MAGKPQQEELKVADLTAPKVRKRTVMDAPVIFF